ncbi:MAG: hypothetical protein OH338_04995 [Candidatus Parvarchaeota archaeon]|nr:hypothetical protein [Candidatus Parvarchaeum tengchongense]
MNECLQEIIESDEIKLPKRIDEIAKGIKEDSNLTEEEKEELRWFMKKALSDFYSFIFDFYFISKEEQ